MRAGLAEDGGPSAGGAGSWGSEGRNRWPEPRIEGRTCDVANRMGTRNQRLIAILVAAVILGLIAGAIAARWLRVRLPW